MVGRENHRAMARGTRREQADGGGEGIEEKKDEKGVKNGGNADLWSDIFLSGGRDVSSPRFHLI